MTTILLVIIYVAFIGLGIPDSLFGAAWPAIYNEFGVAISSAGYVTLIISGGTVISSLLSSRITNRFGTAAVTAVSTSMTAIALYGFSMSYNMMWLCAFSIPLGLGAGAIDTALNNYVALHYKASHMNFLHCFYGIGVSLSPYVMAIALEHSGWRVGYKYAFIIQLIISAITIISVPIWKKAHSNYMNTEYTAPKVLSVRQMLKVPAVCAVCLVFIASCAIEFTCGTWGSTFLTNAKGMPVHEAAKIITFYYIGIAAGRLFSGIFSGKLSGWKIIIIGQTIIFTALIILIMPLPYFVSAIGIFMIGLGNGPVFPNLIHLTPKNFGAENSQSVMGIQMASSYIGIMLMPPLFGILAQKFTAVIFPYYLLIMLVLMGLTTIYTIKHIRKRIVF